MNLKKTRDKKLTLIGGVRFKHESCPRAKRLNPAPNELFGDNFMAKTKIFEIFDSLYHGEVAGMEDWLVFAPVFDRGK